MNDIKLAVPGNGNISVGMVDVRWNLLNRRAYGTKCEHR